MHTLFNRGLRLILTLIFCSLPFATQALTTVELQTILREEGYAITDQPGVHGESTKNALTQFQREHPETGGVTGTLNAQTKSALYNALYTKKGSVLGASTQAPFLVNLSLNAKHPDVARLQAFLNSQGFPIALVGPGSLGQETTFFGPGTQAALIKYQEAHAPEILTPGGYSRGTGMLYPATRAYINARLESSPPESSTEEDLGAIPFIQNLSLGKSGPEVKRLQDFLFTKHFFFEQSSGYFGQKTMSAVQAYQKAKGLSPTGIVDSATRNALNAEITMLTPTLLEETDTPSTTPNKKKSTLSSEITVTASPPFVYPGQSTRIQWSSQKTISCATSNGQTGTRGMFTTSPLTEKTTFSVTCTSMDGKSTTQALVVRTRVTPPSTLMVSVIGNGVVSSAPGGIICGDDCAQSYATRTVITLTAKPQRGSVLESWSGGCTGSSPTCTITMRGTKSVFATFKGGEEAPPKPSSGMTLTLTAEPSSIQKNLSSKITWSSTKAASCTSTFGQSGSSGTFTTPPLTSDTTYSVTCTDADGVTLTKSRTVSVQEFAMSRGAIGKFTIGHHSSKIEASETPISLAYLNDHQAGSRGPIRVSNNHLSLNGSRYRIYGINMPQGAAIPSKADAAKIATNLKKEGFNGVRFIAHDQRLQDPNTWSITYKGQGMLNVDGTYNAAALDYFDYFVHELQKNGIYIQIVLEQARPYQGYADCLNECRGIDMYIPEMIEQQKSAHASLLNHVNPYSGRTYKNDPGIVALEINNENSINHMFGQGTLDEYASSPSSYQKYIAPLESKWEAWASTKYATPEALSQAWGSSYTAFSELTIPSALNRGSMNPQHYKDWIDFLGSVEKTYFDEMYSYLKSTLGVTSLVYGTQLNYTQPWVQDGMDIRDIHTYHGDLGEDTGKTNPTNKRPVFEIENKSQLDYNDPKDMTMYGIFGEKATNKPNFITEYTYRDGNQYLAESEPIFSSYAGFQDLDAIYLFNYHGMNLYTNNQTYPGWYNMTINRVTRPASVLAFRRGDIAPGTPEILKKTKESYLSVLQTYSKNTSVTNFHFGGNVRAPYTKNMYLEIVDSPSKEQIVKGGAAVNGVYIASNNQMVLDPNDSFTVNTPRTKLSVGRYNNTLITLGPDVTVEVGDTMNDYAVVALSSLEQNKDLPGGKMLLTLGGYFTVPGEYPRNPGDRQYSWGTDTPVIESVPSIVSITTPRNITVTALTETGARGKVVPVVRNGSQVEFVVGPEYDTGWYLIE